MRRRVYSISTESESSIEVIALGNEVVCSTDEEIEEVQLSWKSTQDDCTYSTITIQSEGMYHEDGKLYDKVSIDLGPDILLHSFEGNGEVLTPKTCSNHNNLQYFTEKRSKFESVY